MSAHWSVLSLVVLCGSASVWAEDAPVPKPVTVTIHANDNPMIMEALKPFIKDNADRLRGEGPWKPPVGDPSKITKADYLQLLKTDLATVEVVYGKEPITPNSAFWSMPTLAAFYKATGDPKYLKRLVNCFREYCAYVEQEIKDAKAEMAKDQNGRPGIGRYWTYAYAYLIISLEAIKGTPEYDQVSEMLGKVLSARAEVLPIYWEGGAQNRAIDPAFWYDIALKYNPNSPKASELRAYSDEIWRQWWDYRDVEEDDPGYAASDVFVLDAWSIVRGVKPWEDKDGRNLWLFYARQIANDGNYPAYAGGGNIGNYFMGLFIAEMAATRCRDGQAKWLAHRAFFNGRDRIDQMCAGIGSMNYVYLALAYLYADDSIKEIPPPTGLTISQRRYHLMNDFNHLGPRSGFFTMEKRWAPSKLIFRAGTKETDQFMLVQAGGQAGHGHADAGAILQYCGDWAFHLVYGVTRLDDDMEQHNLFTLRDPVKDKPWRATLTGEDYSVPVSGQSSEGAYARIHIQETPGAKVEEAWKRAQAWVTSGGGWPPNIACGYKNWPVRLDRSIVFVNNRFSVVRDVVTPTLPIKAQIGQNWVVGDFGPTVGRNWVNVWTRNPLSGFYYSVQQNDNGKLAGASPIYTAQRDLLIWFVPREDGMMQIAQGPTRSPYYGNYFENLPNRVWYPRTGDWEANKPQAFTTVLLSHLPIANPEKLAATISVIQDSADATVLKVTDGDSIWYIILNSSGRPVTAGTLTADAEAALLRIVSGKPSHLSAWHVTTVVLGKKKLLTARLQRDLDVKVK